MVNQEAEDLKATGNLLFKKQKYLEALKKYKKASVIDPTNVIYWSNIALCYDKMGDLKAFKEAAQKCIDIDSNFIKGYYRLAKAQELLWEFDEAQGTIARGIVLDPYNNDLRELQLSIQDKINKKDSLNKDILHAHTSNLRFLGGLRQGDNNKIPFDSAYGRLKRSPLPPISKKNLDLSQYSKHVRPVFESFYNGDLRIEWYLDDEDFLINGYVPTDTVPVISFIFRMGSHIDIFYYTEQHQKYHCLLTTNQIKNLKIVMIQRFLREKAALLNYHTLLGELVTTLSRECNDERLYKDACDIRLTYTDVCFNRGLDITAISAIHLAEALESAKQYRDAADIYVEIADGNVFTPHPNCIESNIRGYAGVAYQRAQDYISAEREFVGSFRSAGPDWKIDPDTDFYNNIVNMMMFYESAQQAVRKVVYVDEAHKTLEEAGFLFIGLLSIAGFDVAEGGCDLFDRMPIYQQLLKPQYKSPNKALQAIVGATMKPSIEEYHKLLFSYRKDGYKRLIWSVPTRNLEETKTKFLKDEKDRAKSSARKLTTKDTGVVFESRCTNCTKPSKDMKECPCHTVRYCEKKCQVAHWKTHKKVCPNRKKC